MKKAAQAFHQFEFCFPHLDTLLLVEERDGAVVIRASRNTFSPMRKAYFIRELATEGFIDDRYLWANGTDSLGGVIWLVDFSWLKPNPAHAAVSRRFMHRLFVMAMVLWLMIMLVASWR